MLCYITVPWLSLQTGEFILGFSEPSCGSESMVTIQIGTELREGFRHILAAKAEADKARLVVDAARQK